MNGSVSRRLAAAGACALALLISSNAMAQLVISEFRLHGTGATVALRDSNEYIEINNNSGADHTVAGGGTGYAIVASDGVARCVIPNGTVIPNTGHYLCVNSIGYSLAAYPAGNGTNATGDATYTTEIPENTGIAIFNTSVPADFTLANRLDAVGFVGEANTLYKEGTGIPNVNATFAIDFAFYRDNCGKGGDIPAMGNCALTGVKDTDNNAADFIFVDTNGTSAGAGQRLGAPGPKNLSSPLAHAGGFSIASLDSCSAQYAAPNFVRDLTSSPANNSTQGTVDIRRTITNNTGGNITRLRLRIADLTTFPAPAGFADLRPRTSNPVVATVDRPPCGSGTSSVTVNGTTLETPPSQPNGGGFNSTLSVDAVTLAAPLANGASIDVHFLLGVQQTGTSKFAILAEGSPGGGFGPAAVYQFCDGGPCAGPTVSSIVRAGANPTNAATVDYTVTFSDVVTGVDAADFTLQKFGALPGAAITGVTGSGATRTVTISTGTGSGTLRLDVVDNDTIINSASVPLGGFDADASYAGGDYYTIDRAAPNVTVNRAPGQADPTASAPINFRVVFNEPVTGFDASDVTLSGTAGTGASATVTGSGTTYNIAVNGMTVNGAVIATIGAGKAQDAAGNLNLASSTGSGNSVTFNGIDVTPPTVTINAAAAQSNPTAASPINFTVVFSEPVTGFDPTDVLLAGTAGATTAAVSGSGTTYNVAVSGMTAAGTVIATIPAGAATDAASNASLASTSTDNIVAYTADLIPPSVVISLAVGQTNPATTPTINFTATFSEPVNGFTASDVVVGGTAGATSASVIREVARGLTPAAVGMSGGPAVYNLAVSGMTGPGTVAISIPAAAAADAAGNPSTASTGISLVTYAPAPVVGAPALSPSALAALMSILAGITWKAQRRKRGR